MLTLILDEDPDHSGHHRLGGQFRSCAGTQLKNDPLCHRVGLLQKPNRTLPYLELAYDKQAGQRCSQIQNRFLAILVHCHPIPMAMPFSSAGLSPCLRQGHNSFDTESLFDFTMPIVGIGKNH